MSDSKLSWIRGVIFYYFYYSYYHTKRGNFQRLSDQSRACWSRKRPEYGNRIFCDPDRRNQRLQNSLPAEYVGMCMSSIKYLQTCYRKLLRYVHTKCAFAFPRIESVEKQVVIVVVFTPNVWICMKYIAIYVLLKSRRKRKIRCEPGFSYKKFTPGKNNEKNIL